jgi:hypothetical protein
MQASKVAPHRVRSKSVILCEAFQLVRQSQSDVNRILGSLRRSFKVGDVDTMRDGYDVVGWTVLNPQAVLS